MKRFQRHLSTFALIATCTVAAAPSRAEPATASTSASDRARVLFKQAENAFGDRNYAEARKFLLEAWALGPSYDIASALGQAELELKMYRQAAEHIDYALRHMAPTSSLSAVEAVKKDFQRAKAEVAEVRLNVNEASAKIFVDGDDVGTSPLPASIYVDPGSRTFEARLEPGRAVKNTTALNAGNAYTVELIVPPAAPGAAPASPSSAPTPSQGADRTTWLPTYVSGGLAVVAVGIGIGFAVDASAAKSDGEAKLSQAKSQFGDVNPCSPTTGGGSGVCSDLTDLQHRRTNSRDAGTVSFVVGGVFAAAAVGSYFLWARPATEGGSTARVGAWVGNGGGSLVIQGSF